MPPHTDSTRLSSSSNRIKSWKYVKGTAKDKEDGKDIGFFALIISDKKKASVVFIEVNADASKDERAKLEGILKSIKKA